MRFYKLVVCSIALCIGCAILVPTVKLVYGWGFVGLFVLWMVDAICDELKEIKDAVKGLKQ